MSYRQCLRRHSYMYVIGSTISMMLAFCHAYREHFEQGGKFDTRSLFAAADEVR